MRRGVISEIVCVPGCKTPWKNNKYMFDLILREEKRKGERNKGEKLEEYDAIKGANTGFYLGGGREKLVGM